MSSGLRRVDPTLDRRWRTRLVARLATMPTINEVSRRIFWKIDPVLLRVTGGRMASTLSVPTTVLETRGAKSGELRRHAVIYFHDGPDCVVIAASHAGRPRNPHWYHNLRADPHAIIGGVDAVAREVEDPMERARLWMLADQVFPAYVTYRQRAGEAGRTIPLIELQLAPADRISG